MADFTIAWDLKTLDSFSKNLDKLDKRFDKVDQNLDKIGKSSSKNSAKFTNGIKNMAGAVLSFASLKAFATIGMTFQDNLADLSAITGATGDDLDTLSQKAFEMGKEFATSGANVLEGMKLVGSAKPELLENLDALAEVTKQTLLLSSASGLDLPTAVGAAVGALNQFNAGSERAAEFVNILAAGSKFGSSEIGPMAEAIDKAGGLANKAGFSFAQLNSVFQVLSKNKLMGAEAGTGFKTFLSLVSSKGSKVSKLFGDKLNPSIVGADKALENLTKANLTTGEAFELFGTQGANVALILSENNKLYGEMTDKITGTNTAQDQSAVRLATVSAKMRQLGTIIEEKLVSTFVRMEPKINSMVEGFGQWIDTLDDEKIDGFADSMLALLDIVTGLAKVGAFIGGGFSAVGTAIGETIGATVATVDPGISFDAMRMAQGGGKSEVVVKIEAPPGVVTETTIETDGSAKLETGENF